MKLGFSEFHDLMHPVGSATCRSLPGGTRRHLSLWWDYKFTSDLWFHWAGLKHLFGRHSFQETWVSIEHLDDLLSEKPDKTICVICGKEKGGD